MLLLLLLSCAPGRAIGENVGTGLRTALAEEDPKLQQAVSDLGAALTSGALAGLSEEERRVALQAQIDALIEALAPQLSAAIQDEIGPALAEALSNAVQEALGELASAQGQADLETIAGTIAEALVAGLAKDAGPELALALERDLGPALKTVLERDLAPTLQTEGVAFAQAASEKAASALGAQLAEDLDGPLGAALEARATNIIEATRQAAETEGQRWQGFFWSALVALAFVVTGMGGLGWFLLKEFREARGLRAALDLVTTNIKRSEDDEAVKALTRRIRDEGKETEGGQALSAFLKERRHNKIEIE
ncbi:MAG: hypothetical protein VX899_00535 [Myxococcota bacterium]|nr:hypothetical protein [Myxococcota bacterium]